MIKETVQSKINEIFTDCDVDASLIDEFDIQRLKRFTEGIERIVKDAYAEQHKDRLDNIKEMINRKIDTLIAESQEDTSLFEDVDEEIVRSIFKNSLNESISKLKEEAPSAICAVCGEINLKPANLCSKCGFGELGKKCATKDEEIQWLKEKVIPYGINYILSDMMPTEAKRIRLTLGLEDGISHSDEEVAQKEDVCVNRIYQHKAKLHRALKRLPCTLRLQELQNK